MDQHPKQQIVERLKQANNILVTVSNNPSVDQLTSAIGFTLLLNKLGKHGTAVFSGQVPSTLEFLKPQETLEKNTDSLRDFIIALDKSKADKLRYKLEDTYVKIFITPYRTSLSEKDLEFSQGDFNVEVVIALGVKEREQLDAAITAHGRILHDATVIGINNHEASSLGVINWNDPQASSLSEMLVSLGEELNKNAMDEQMATAFLTGIVAETDRFRNEKTTPQTMTLAGHLMAAGANQQLVATQLEVPEPTPEPKPKRKTKDDTGSGEPAKPKAPDTSPKPSAAAESPKPEEPPKPQDGTLEIEHTVPGVSVEPKATEETAEPTAEIDIDQHGNLRSLKDVKDGASEAAQATLPTDKSSGLVLEPPTLGSKLTANTEPEHAILEPTTDAMSVHPTGTAQPLLTHDSGNAPKDSPAPAAPSEGSSSLPPLDTKQTLTDIEEAVHSDHLEPEIPAPVTPAEPPALPVEPAPELDEARQAVEQAAAASSTADPLEPIAALNAQPVDLELHTEPETPSSPTAQLPSLDLPATDLPPIQPPPPVISPTEPPAVQSGVPPTLVIPDTPPQDQSGAAGPPTAPPPVPPPLVPPVPPPNDNQDDQDNNTGMTPGVAL